MAFELAMPKGMLQARNLIPVPQITLGIEILHRCDPFGNPRAPSQHHRSRDSCHQQQFFSFEYPLLFIER